MARCSASAADAWCSVSWRLRLLFSRSAAVSCLWLVGWWTHGLLYVVNARLEVFDDQRVRTLLAIRRERMARCHLVIYMSSYAAASGICSQCRQSCVIDHQ